MTIRRVQELECDGCGKKVEWWCRDGRPEDWRKLRVVDGIGKQSIFDVCSPRCASKAVDSTYEKSDRLDAMRQHPASPFLRAVPSP